ncbi:hypothetical protein QBC35DRAFT_481998 [Podospora australis]|uniref:magnesium chelatase n=1 Tax=Podospora australis TaxID=1536484 RepID=A0AAN6X4S4_9PEZI|nr:hypothetical protein QBC35DRAFT_481998 [Podospora australis]
MAMADEQLLDKIQSLSDLELATLLCLVAREHCLIGTLPDYVNELAEELRLVASKTFNLTSAIVSCHSHTTLDEFATGLLVPQPSRGPPSPGHPRSSSPYRPRHDHQQPSTAGGVGPSVSGSYFPSTSPALRPAPGAFSSRITPGATIPPSPLIGAGATGNSQATQQPHIANVILAKDLDRAPRAVQIQALELLRTRRIFTRTSVQTAPKQFLFIALVGAPSGGQARVTPHLNDFFYLAHWHDPDEDGFEHLDEELGHTPRRNEDPQDDASSTASSRSVVKRSSSLGSGFGGSPLLENQWLSNSTTSNGMFQPQRQHNMTTKEKGLAHTPRLPPQPEELYESTTSPTTRDSPAFTEDDISLLAQLTTQAHVEIDVTRYQMNIVSFLRMHRAVAGGLSPQATKHVEYLAKSLAPLHGLDYVTPSLIALAAKKVYLHRLTLVGSADKERSMQWGSELGAVNALLEDVGPEDVIEEVLGSVGVPN